MTDSLVRRWCLAASVVAAVLLPPIAVAAESLGARDHARTLFSPPNTGPVLDVSLTSRGELIGVVLGQAEVPVVGEVVGLWHAGQLVAEVETDFCGRFMFRGVRGGVYGLRCAGVREVCRVWGERSSPPSAQERVLILLQPAVIRGQHDWTPWFTKQTVLSTGMLGGAVLAPVIVVGQRQSAS